MADGLSEALPSLDAELPDPGPTLVRRGTGAGDATFVAGARAVVTIAAGTRGRHTVRIHPLLVAEDFGLDGAEVRDVAITPIHVERRLDLSGVEVVERVFVPREHPAAVFEWRAPAGATLEVSWRAGFAGASSPAGGEGAAAHAEAATNDRGAAHGNASARENSALVWSREGRALWLAGGGSSDAAVFVLSREPESWDVEPVGDDGAAGLRVRLGLRLGPGESVRMAVVGTTEGAVALVAFLSSLRPEDLVRARAAAARRLQRERLSVSAPDERIGPALEWAQHSLDSLVVEAPGVGRSIVAGYDAGCDVDGIDAGAPEMGGRDVGALVARGREPAEPVFRTRDAVAAALAALAVGAFDVARDVLAFLSDHLDGSGRAPGLVTLTGEARYDDPDATALYLLLAARYLAWTGGIGFVRDVWPHVRVACERAREAAEHAGAAAVSTGLAPFALAELAVAAESIGEDALAEALRSRVVRPGGPTLPSFLGAAGTAWAEFAAGRSGAAAQEWLRSVEALLAKSCASAMEAAAVVNGFVYGLLGVEPDAVKGRLRLRPQLPASWDRLEMRRIRMGDAVVAMTCTRDGDRHVFRLEQEEGAVPVTIVFEPMLPAPRLAAARVDGVSAELDPRPHGERMLVPVQIALDAERVVELDVAHDVAPPKGLRVWRT